MNLLINHYKNLVCQDYIHKYQIKNTKFLPQLKCLTLSAKFSPSYKSSVHALFEILSFHKAHITQSRNNILTLSLRKGEPVGVKLVLRRKPIYDFLSYLLFEILPSLKKFKGFLYKSNSIHTQIKDIFVLDETTYIYMYINDLPCFDIVINGENLNPNFFLACRYPLKKIKS